MGGLQVPHLDHVGGSHRYDHYAPDRGRWVHAVSDPRVEMGGSEEAVSKHARESESETASSKGLASSTSTKSPCLDSGNEKRNRVLFLVIYRVNPKPDVFD